jgi:FkbM family methyltransferase
LSINYLQKKINGLKKRAKWFSYGITFFRSGNIKIPNKLKVNGKVKVLSFTEEKSKEFRFEFEEICVNDCYRLKKLKKLLPSVEMVLDIGANQGLFLLAARQTFKKAMIYCYEPNETLIPFLGHNAFQLQAKYFNEAVTREECTVDLEFAGSSLHTKTKVSPNGQTKGSSFNSIISIIVKEIDIVKLDCEGAEWEILEDRDSWRPIKSITMEYHLWAKPGSTSNEIASILRGLGFSILEHDQISQEFGLITAIRK